jgi:hypothetical protein
MTVEQRVQKLESQNRRLTWALTAMVGLAVIGGILGLKPERDDSVAAKRTKAVTTVVQAGRFEVLDSRGKIVAVMGVNEPGTGGVVYTTNARGAMAVQMGVADDDRGVVWTYDHAGHLREDVR